MKPRLWPVNAARPRMLAPAVPVSSPSRASSPGSSARITVRSRAMWRDLRTVRSLTALKPAALPTDEVSDVRLLPCAALAARFPRTQRSGAAPSVGRALAGDLPGPGRPEGVPPDDGRGHRRDRRPHDPRRRPVAGRLRLLQLPRLRPGPRDHRRDPGLRGRVGHAPELVSPARQPDPLRADRGAPHRAAGLRGLA